MCFSPLLVRLGGDIPRGIFLIRLSLKAGWPAMFLKGSLVIQWLCGRQCWEIRGSVVGGIIMFIGNERRCFLGLELMSIVKHFW